MRPKERLPDTLAESLLARHRAIVLLVQDAPASLRTEALMQLLADQGDALRAHKEKGPARVRRALTPFSHVRSRGTKALK